VALNAGLMSSHKDDWETPWDFFRRLDAVYHFDLDVCATPSNAKCPRFLTPEDDGLAQTWDGVCWMNPPYGRNIGPWVAKAHAESQRGVTVVCLIPARTDTRWWHRHVMKATYIAVVPGRIKFVGAKQDAPFPSAVVVFGPGPKPPLPTLLPSLTIPDEGVDHNV